MVSLCKTHILNFGIIKFVNLLITPPPFSGQPETSEESWVVFRKVRKILEDLRKVPVEGRAASSPSGLTGSRE